VSSTGKNRFKDSANLFKDAEDYVHFQHAVYAHWVKSQPEFKTSDAKLIAGYYFTSDVGEWARVEAPFKNFSEHFAITMSVFHAALTTGEYSKNPDSCRNCAYRLVCGGVQERRKNFVVSSPQLENIESSLVRGG
jgi:PD-(D/E)XK nuclease superfamily